MTPDERAAVEPFLVDWFRRAFRAGPLTPDERDAIEAAIGRCYVRAGLTPPETIVWVASPVAASAAATRLIPRRRPGHVGRFLRAAVYVLAWTLLGAVLLALWAPIPGAAAGFLWGVFRCWRWTWRDWRDETEQRALRRDQHEAGQALAATGSRIWTAHVEATRDEELVSTIVGPVTALNSQIGAALRHVTRRNPVSGWNITTDADAFWRLERDEVGTDRRDALRDWAQAGTVTWWPHPGFAIVSEPPAEIHLESLPGGGCRPHHALGPAVRWTDGPSLWFWHGVEVPHDLISPGWNVDRIHAERNSELQRAAIERMGWLTYLERAGLELIASAPDPGNPPHKLSLYADTSGRLHDAHILVMTNGSPDRAGASLRYAEPVPDTFLDPVEAAAWQYGVPAETYRGLGRRT